MKKNYETIKAQLEQAQATIINDGYTPWFAVCKGDDDNDHGAGSGNWYKALLLANTLDCKCIVALSAESDYCYDVVKLEVE